MIDSTTAALATVKSSLVGNRRLFYALAFSEGYHSRTPLVTVNKCVRIVKVLGHDAGALCLRRLGLPVSWLCGGLPADAALQELRQTDSSARPFHGLGARKRNRVLPSGVERLPRGASKINSHTFRLLYTAIAAAGALSPGTSAHALLLHTRKVGRWRSVPALSKHRSINFLS